MRILFFLIAASLLMRAASAEEATVPLPAPVSKKLIEWGWDSPTADYLRKHIVQMEARPFDGVVINPTDSRGIKIVWSMWGRQKFAGSDFDPMVKDLLNTPFKSFTDRFIRVNVTPGDVDWLDDEAFGIVVNNFAIMARAAKNSRCKGFMFDLEQYKSLPFNYEKVRAKHDAPASDYKRKVRERGRELIQAIANEFPDIVIIFPWMNAAYQWAPPKYQLLPAFLDGILDKAPESARLIDGTERAYYSKSSAELETLYKGSRSTLAEYSSQPDLYARKISVGLGLWLDAVTKDKKSWSAENSSQNYFTPDEFRQSAAHALRLTDQYVWIYSEKLDWWEDGERLKDYDRGLRQAREDISISDKGR